MGCEELADDIEEGLPSQNSADSGGVESVDVIFSEEPVEFGELDPGDAKVPLLPYLRDVGDAFAVFILNV